MIKTGKCAHCKQTVKVEQRETPNGLEWFPSYHDWPKIGRAICKGYMMVVLNVSDEDEDE